MTDIPLRRIDGTPTTLADFDGQVLLVVNVASKCGLTPQYAGLEKLYETYRDRGFAVLGFPANQFMGQEPGENAEIQQFCSLTYGVQFPMFEKIVVKGEGIHPLYQALIHAVPKADTLGDDSFAKKLAAHVAKAITGGSAEDVSWNFEKFLLDRHGNPVARYAPSVTPEAPGLVAAIEAELAKA
ncbi:MAG TPA: glutathione peroxidase [Oscillatoriaceae cyanobacterium]